MTVNRQHATPVHLTADGVAAVPLLPIAVGTAVEQFSEAYLRDLLYAHPTCLPIAEIDPVFAGPVPICTEMLTPAGPVDLFMVTPGGLPVIVECKLWRNPEARRKVIGQILDYAKELSRWTASDVQREVARRTGTRDSLLDLVRVNDNSVDEVAFMDALSHNLRRGRILLLIVGDGIREGVESIIAYLQNHAALHFTLGLVELPLFSMADGSLIVAPRVLARTEAITRTVVAIPDGYALSDGSSNDDDDDIISPSERESRAAGRARRRSSRLIFWTVFLDGLTLDDPDQPVPGPSRAGHIVFRLPVPGNSCWISVYRSGGSGQVGIFLSGHRGTPGETAARMLAEDEQALRQELGPSTQIAFGNEFPVVSDSIALADFDDPAARDVAFIWLRKRANDFVNALRPRIKAALADLDQG